LVATITDKSGVPISGIGLPVLFWNSTSLPNWSSVTGVSLGNNQYSFTFGAGVVLNDEVHYYIAAQDNASSPNVISKPLAGANGFTANPPASISVIANPARYYVLPSLSGTKTVGTGGDYPTLTGTGGFFEAMNGKILTGNLKINVISNLSEPGTVALNQVQTDGPNNFTVTITSDGPSERLITNNGDVTMITLNGADRISFDGQRGSNFLHFRTTSTVNPIISFTNDATYDTIRSCTFESGGTSTGMINLGTSTLPLGNSYNVFLKNLFRDRSDITGAYPVYCISSTGTAGNLNGNNVINGNDFSNFKTAGVFLSTIGNGNGWQIINNSFYNTLSLATNTNTYPIYITAGANCGNNVVSGNFIGGTATQCGGSPWANSGNTTFYGIWMTVDPNNATTVDGNVVKNFSFTGTGGGSFRGIYTQGKTNIGNTVGNMIGDTLTANSIMFGGTGTCYGIYANGISTVNNNKIANITSTHASNLGLMHGIRLEGDFPMTAERNWIFNIGPATGAANQVATNQIAGIYLGGATTTTSTFQIDNNVISMGGNGGVHNIEMVGIYVLRSTGAYKIYQNSISLSGTASPSNTRGSAGIVKFDASTVVCKDNIISNTRTNGTGGTGSHYAIKASNTASFTSDFNDLYSSNAATTAVWGTTDCNLANWVSLSSGDANSLSVNPNFASNSNLRTTRDTLDNRGTSIAGLDYDYAWIARSNPPDLGAFEFGTSLGKTLTLKLFLEGFFNAESGLMNKAINTTDGENTFEAFPGSVVDTLTIALAQTTEPYNTVYSKSGLQLHTDGTITVNNIPGVLSGSYYIIVRHRNHVETWSEAINFGTSSPNCDLTDNASKAWGSNLKPMGSYFAIYAGDANGDQYVDVVDVGMVFNKNLNGDFGYQAEDMNGDGFIDVLDVGLVFNNNLLGAGQNTPINPMGPIHTNKR